MSGEKGTKDPGPSLEDAATSLPEARPSNVRLKTGISGAELRAFLGQPATQTQIVKVVKARVDKATPDDVIAEIAQQACDAALRAKSPPRSMDTAMGWMGTVTARAVANYFRREAMHARWLNPEAEVEELPSRPEESQNTAEPEWLLTAWLRPRVAGNERDQETYELLAYKARHDKTHAQVAADHAMTEGALKSRIHSLRTKYEPQWKRRERMILLLILFGIAVLLAIAWLLWPPDPLPNGGVPQTTTPHLDLLFGGENVSHPYLGPEPDAGSH